ncbi:hypothetical protein K501DRAFT_256493 [Backusella circina FSU 941]|nr:hypothetical protein K501DRAFT_256493 [Backusella circina FSU 941]
MLPKTLVEARIDQLRTLVQDHCPSHHVDFYIFVVAILCVICSAIFTFVARSLSISMWCPLLLLLIPTGLSFWTSKRRSMLLVRIKELKQTLKEFTKNDSSHRVGWSFQRVHPDNAPCASTRFCLMIMITELDSEMGLNAEELPSYQAALQSNHLPPSYIDIVVQPEPAIVPQRML